MDKRRPADILKDGAELHSKKSDEYGANYTHLGHVMAGLFPEGVKLTTVDDWNRMQFIIMFVTKLTRYCSNWRKGGHADSVKDIMVYAAILLALDEDIQEIPF